MGGKGLILSLSKDEAVLTGASLLHCRPQLVPQARNRPPQPPNLLSTLR